MTKINTMQCDRCGKEFVVERERTVLALQIVPVKRQEDGKEIPRFVDLCDQCSIRFLGWYRIK